MMRDRLEKAIAALSEDDQVVWMRMQGCRDDGDSFDGIESETYTECVFAHTAHHHELNVAIFGIAELWAVVVWHFNGAVWSNQQRTEYEMPKDAAAKIIEECREWLKYAQLEQAPA